MEKYICIHGHFYQPPRENPWLEDVELQDSAYPHHDWNARITEECYRQNAASRILGADRRIMRIVNNYERISFNFGPTLLSWMETHTPDVYEKILEADRLSRKRFSGHGSALAQVYNHMIMPLANDRDKLTQVRWGIADFEHRFGRRPEGMWLAETAVDTPTLEVLASQGIAFTILSPRQARRVRRIGAKKWKDVDEATVDTTVPYTCTLPSGAQITLFFYNGPVSHDVAYGGLLHSGENMANRLTGAFPADNERPARLVHIATDGESFGHHHRHGDMALAYCIHQIQNGGQAKITIYGEYLEKYPPEDEAEIFENSSWSCVHGVERWRSNCGCSGDQSLSGQQTWREPLRSALDRLCRQTEDLYVQRISAFVQDPWAIRNDYIAVILDCSEAHVDAWLAKWIGRQPSPEEKVLLVKLLEMERNAMLMFTSCGWFFDDISGIETIQILQYAARALQLARDIQGVDLEPEFKERLSAALSIKLPKKTGRDIYEMYVEPCKVDLNRVGAHLAMSSIFQEDGRRESAIFVYRTRMEMFDRQEAGIQVLTMGRATIRSQITFEQKSVDLVGFYLGGQNLFCAVGSQMPIEDYRRVKRSFQDAFRRGDSSEILRLMNVMILGQIYTLSHLFKDEQRRIMHRMLDTTWQEIEGSFRHIYEHNYSIMQLMRNMNMPLPAGLQAPADFIINQELCREIAAEPMNLERMQVLREEVERFSLKLDQKRLTFEAGRRINALMQEFRQDPENLEKLLQIEQMMEILLSIIGAIDLQESQNLFFKITQEVYPFVQRRAGEGDASARQWVEHFQKLARLLGLAVS
jgi:alpha-amylase/alpha-mannosidase (GH57 family)